MDDVIELTAEGVFEVPSPPKIKQQQQQQQQQQQPEVIIKETKSIVNIAPNNVLDSLASGEFKVYRKDLFLYCLVRLGDGESISKISFDKKVLKIQLNSPSNACLTIDLAQALSGGARFSEGENGSAAASHTAHVWESPT